MDRRKIITGIGTVGITAVAGCSSSSGGSNGQKNTSSGQNGTNDGQQGESSTQNIEPSEPWQEKLDRCSDSEARIAVRDIRVQADSDDDANKVLVVIENLDIVSLNVVEVSVTYNPEDDGADSQRRFWDKGERTLDGEDLQSYTIDASYSRGVYEGTTYRIGSGGEVLDVNIYTADDPDIGGNGGPICWKPTES